MNDPISADLPELRLLAQFAGIAPSRMAAALNNPDRIEEYLTVKEVASWAEGYARLLILLRRVQTSIDIASNHLGATHVA